MTGHLTAESVHSPYLTPSAVDWTHSHDTSFSLKDNRARPSIGHRHPDDFTDRGDAFFEFFQAALAQALHAQADSGAFDVSRRSAVEHQFAQLLAHRHNLGQ